MLVLPFTMRASVTYVVAATPTPERTGISLEDGTTTLSIREAVIAEFGTSSPMVDVARCESTFRQFNSDGDILRGIVNSKDVGVFQINEKFHLEKSKEMGYDIYSIDGNIQYARYLYDHQGLKPWKWSKDCWG